MIDSWRRLLHPASRWRDFWFRSTPWALLTGLLLATALPLRAKAESTAYPAVGDQATVRVGEVDYINAEVFLRRYNLHPQWLEVGQKQRFSSAWTSIELEADSREIQFNGLRLFLGSGTLVREQHLWIDRIDAEKLLAPLLKPATYATQARPVRKIVIDAGHGGKDGGTANRELKLQEKTFALDVAQRLRHLLEAQGFEVVMTRNDDRFIELRDRAVIGQTEQADLFVSVHFNAAGRSAVHGTETYVFTPRHQRSTSSEKADPSDHTEELGNQNDAWNAVLGYQVHRSLCDQLGGMDRGLKRARFAVLRLAKCPAVLVESAYLSNPAEARKIATPAFRAEIAQGIANGVIAYAHLVLTTQSS